MIALLLAAQVAAAPGVPTRNPFDDLALEALSPSKRAALAPAACGPSPVQKVDQGRAPVGRKLGELPKAHHEIAVLRTEGGCPKPVIVRYNVGR